MKRGCTARHSDTQANKSQSYSQRTQKQGKKSHRQRKTDGKDEDKDEEECSSESTVAGQGDGSVDAKGTQDEDKMGENKA